jgi:hypothetical protein
LCAFLDFPFCLNFNRAGAPMAGQSPAEHKNTWDNPRRWKRACPSSANPKSHTCFRIPFRLLLVLCPSNLQPGDDSSIGLASSNVHVENWKIHQACDATSTRSFEVMLQYLMPLAAGLQSVWKSVQPICHLRTRLGCRRVHKPSWSHRQEGPNQSPSQTAPLCTLSQIV